MPRLWFALAPLLVLLPLPGCSGVQDQGAAAPVDGASLPRYLHPLALETDGFEDLEFLRPLLDGKRIVQLGENTHGLREFNLLKARIVRFLHQELGYDVLAFESALYQCYAANLTAAEAPAFSMTRRSTLGGCPLGVWHTKGVLPLFEYLRETRRGDRPLHLAGIDVQPIGANKASRPGFLAHVVAAADADYAAEVFALDSTFLDVYARGGQARRAYFRETAGQQMVGGYDRLAAFLRENEAAIEAAGVRRDQRLMARQTAASLAWYIRQQAAPTTREVFERRDQGMAENLMFLLDEFYPDQKVIVWGHNFHLRHDNAAIPPDTTMYPDVAVRTMGSRIRERYGQAVYTVGLYVYQGQATNNSGTVFEIEPAAPGSLEARLHEVGLGALFIDLSQAPRTPETAWMDRPITARYNGETPLSMVVRHQYDALLFVDVGTPRETLY